MRTSKLGRLGHSHRTTGNGKTAQSYIAGIGASGALLAGAVVTFVFLVGAVSFEVWPTAAQQNAGDGALGVAELSGPGGSGPAATSSLGEAVTRLAAAVPSDGQAPKAGGGLKGGGGGGDQGSGGGVDQGSAVTPGGGSDGSGTAGTPPDDTGSGTPSGGGNAGGSNRPGGSGGNGSGRPNGGSGSTGSGTASGGSGSSGSGSGGSGSSGSNHSSR